MFIFKLPLKIFPCRGKPNLHASFLTVTFQAEHLSLILLPLFRLQCNNFTCLIIHRTLQLPCKTNLGILGVGQVDFSLDLLIILKVPKSKTDQKIHFSFQFTSPCSTCRNVGKSNYKKKYRSVLTCPFCMVQDGIVVPNILQGVTFNSFPSIDLNFIESLGKFLQRYQQHREILVDY